MRWRQVFTLYAVAAALGGWYWFIEKQPVQAPKGDEDRPFLELDTHGLDGAREREERRRVEGPDDRMLATPDADLHRQVLAAVEALAGIEHDVVGQVDVVAA